MQQRQYIGRYRVVGRLGKGGMGTVVRALDELQGREVAIKLPNESDPDDLKRLRQECDVLMQLQHHAIVEVYGSGSTADVPFYIVMELVEGLPVDQVLRRQGGHLEPRAALKIALGVAEALAYAHRPPLRIIHRDIKPSNVLIRASDAAVKVTDFGIAAVLSERSGKTAIGTLAYMAPEQALGHGVDERTDLYSLGALLYELLTGQPPPRLASAPAQRPSLWLGSMPPEMSLRIDLLALGLLAHDRDQRTPQSAAAVVEDLKAILENRPTRPASGAQPGSAINYAPTQRASTSLPGANAPLPPTQRASTPPVAPSYPAPSGMLPGSRPSSYTPPPGYQHALPRSRRAVASSILGAIGLTSALLLLVFVILSPRGVNGAIFQPSVRYFILFWLAGLSCALSALVESWAARRDIMQGKRGDPSGSARAGRFGGYLSLGLLVLAFLAAFIFR